MNNCIRQHPEVSFAIMNAGNPMIHPKRRPAGQEERIALLRGHFPDVLTTLAKLPHFTIDAVDAYAMLWTAKRLADGASRTLPGAPTIDRRGLRMEMVA